MSSKINYGIILGIISGASSITIYLLGAEAMTEMSWVTYPFSILSIGLLIYFGTQLRKENGGYFTFGQAYGSLMVMSVISALVSGVVSLVLFVLIDSEFGANYLDVLREQMYNEGLNEQSIETIMSFTEWTNPFSATGAVVSVLISIAGAGLLNLLFALIVRKSPPEGASNLDKQEDILA